MTGLVQVSQAGLASQPSPSIWKDCPLEKLNDNGQGFYFHKEFLGGPLVNTAITAALLSRLTVEDLQIDGDDDSVITHKTAELGGYIDLETDGDDNDAISLFTEPFGKVVLNSGNKVWGEARFEVGALADQGIFIGMAEKAALSRDVVADDGVLLIGESLFGFRMRSDDTNDIDFVYKLDAGTEVVVVADASVSTAITAQGGTAAVIAANTEIKVGWKFDGKESLAVFVNGYKVHTLTVDTDLFPDGVLMGMIACLKTGTGAAVSIALDWVRGGAMGKS